MSRQRVIIMGAAGRDFHNFNVYFRDNPAYEVVAFTATQIPNIEGRTYPAKLAGAQYPKGIPIHPETELVSLIAKLKPDQVIFAYSDVSHETVMHKASQVLAAAADFRMMGARGYKAAAIRPPVPSGDLVKQAVQRFASYKDLAAHDCTIEEREEYEPHIARGIIVYAGVDYERILRQAEAEVDVILWDGGNNDLSFYQSDLHIVVVDPHRPGHELLYHPGEANLLMADVVVINKVDTASTDSVMTVRNNVRARNPKAIVIEAASP